MSTRVLPEFELLSPRTVDEALEQARLHGEHAEILAGGTDVLVKMKIGSIAPKILIGIGRIGALRTVSFDDQSGLTVGALATIGDLDQSPVIRKNYPILRDATDVFANAQILNMGTVGGNLCNASPAGDLIPPLLTMDAEVELIAASARRMMKLAEFCVGPGKTVRRHDELLSAVFVPKPATDHVGGFVRITRTAEDLAKVSAAAVFAVRGGSFFDVRVAFGAVAPTVIRAPEIESYLEGRPIGDSAIETAMKMASDLVRPITDLRSTAEYRKKVAGVALKRAINRAMMRGKTA